MKAKTKILFVCMGNICRSPSAQGVFEKLINQKGLSEKFVIDSAGTTNYHVGGRVDKRSQHFASLRGIDLSRQRARQVETPDFSYYDYIIAMDDDNFENLKNICPSLELEVKLYKMMDYVKKSQYNEVPDPYYGGEDGFYIVLDLLEEACEQLLLSIA